MSARVTPARVEWTVSEIFKVFGVPAGTLTRDAPIATFGIDSIELAELRQVIEDEFGVEFSEADRELLLTIGDVIDLVVLRAAAGEAGPDLIAG